MTIIKVLGDGKIKEKKKIDETVVPLVRLNFISLCYETRICKFGFCRP